MLRKIRYSEGRRIKGEVLRAADRLMSLIVEALLDLSSYLKNKQILIDSGCLGRSAGACPAETPAGPA
jgi:hypothetical protein